MDEFARQAFVEWEARRSSRRRIVWLHVILWTAVNLLLFVIWLATGADFPWFVFPLFATLVPLTAHAAVVYVVKRPDDLILEKARRDSLDPRTHQA